MRKRNLVVFSACFLLFANAGLTTDKADVYYKGAIRLHGAENLEKVFDLYARSAEWGHAISQYNLAMMYSNGESVNVDYQQAVYWFKKSAQQGFPPAQHRLGEMYYFEKGGLPRDLDMAVALFEKGAQRNDPDAQMNLAMLYGTGEGLSADPEKALFWIRRASEGGHQTAADYLEVLSASEDGRFTPGQQSGYWIKKAAELGIREAQEVLGMHTAGRKAKISDQKK